MNNTDLTPAENDEKKSPFNLPPLSDQTKAELKALGWACLKGVCVAGAVMGTLAIAAALSRSEDEENEENEDLDAVDADEDL